MERDWIIIHPSQEWLTGTSAGPGFYTFSLQLMDSEYQSASSPHFTNVDLHFLECFST